MSALRILALHCARKLVRLSRIVSQQFSYVNNERSTIATSSTESSARRQSSETAKR